MFMEEPLHSLTQEMIPAVERAMKDVLLANVQAGDPFYGMMHYHMGWVDESFQPLRANQGKRVRPLLALLSSQSAGGDWEKTVPGAAALELLHNFTLIHDDIQDASPTRRGRPTVWSLWGVNLAINSGDAMFALAHESMIRMADRGVPAKIVVQALRQLDRTCIDLTIGQHADMLFEDKNDVTVDQYLEMIGGKTAGLISLSTGLGALVAESEDGIIEHYASFGWDLGMAFQVRDDILGIWGDESIIGKSSATDIVTRKKSLPVLYGLSKSDELVELYFKSGDGDDFVHRVVEILDGVGAHEFALSYEEKYAQSALTHLEEAQPEGDAAVALRQLTMVLLNRQS
jgi:geranylgeranyl diphosphate synthase type I